MIKVAIINLDNIVENIIVCEDSYVLSDNEVICNDDTSEAIIGGSYNKTLNKFVSLKPYPSWTLDEDGFTWNAPVEMPNDEFRYWWNEENQSWIKMIPQV